MSTTTTAVEISHELDQLDEYLVTHHLRGSWMRRSRDGRPLSAPERRTGFAALHWEWSDISKGLFEAGRLVPVGPSGLTEMRSIRGVGASDKAINMNAQILMPGERTRAHRNMKNETRLVHSAPRGAVFVCDGEAFPMLRGDLIVSPTWTNHDHYNDGDTPAIWVDGYDTGYANLASEINERFPIDAPFQEIVRKDGYTNKTTGRVTHWSAREQEALRPPVRYPWAETESALDALRNGGTEMDPFDGYHMMFVSPVDGGSTLPTIAWHVQLLPAGTATKVHRHNSTTCYHAFEGQGQVVIEDEIVDWETGDLFVVPAWTWHSHNNAGGSDAILFSIDDWPARKKLGFYRREDRD